MMKDGIVACSDAQKREYQKKNKELIEFLESIDIMTVMSSCIYEKDGGPFPDSAEEKANGLIKMFTDPYIEEIYDISGGDIGAV